MSKQFNDEFKHGYQPKGNEGKVTEGFQPEIGRLPNMPKPTSENGGKLDNVQNPVNIK